MCVYMCVRGLVWMLPHGGRDVTDGRLSEIAGSWEFYPAAAAAAGVGPISKAAAVASRRRVRGE